jgi:hypothetical protein
MSEQNETGAPAGGVQMTVWDAIRSRRDVRAFDGRPIPAADLDQILEAGRRSPSASNWQPWDFIVVTDREQLTELAKVWQGGRHVAQSAATIALIAPASDERRRAPFDLGQATMSIMLEAAGLGIGSGWRLIPEGIGALLQRYGCADSIPGRSPSVCRAASCPCIISAPPGSEQLHADIVALEAPCRNPLLASASGQQWRGLRTGQDAGRPRERLPKTTGAALRMSSTSAKDSQIR